jgi:DNA-binding transcriptional LysR family regulator
MQLSRADLADFAYFIAVVRHRSFRRAAVEFGVSASALSHAISGLEARLGVRLLNRTTRSVTLTAAGEELQATIQGPMDHIGQAVENLNRFRDAPAGRVRINVLEDAVPLILEPVLPVFVDRFPDVELDISVNNRLIDVIGSGFDAGIPHGDTVPEDMIAQRLSGAFRQTGASQPAVRSPLCAHPSWQRPNVQLGIRACRLDNCRCESGTGDGRRKPFSRRSRSTGRRHHLRRGADPKAAPGPRRAGTRLRRLGCDGERLSHLLFESAACADGSACPDRAHS